MKKPVVIGIAGGSGSGKSTVTKELIKLIDKDSVTVIEQDSYYKDQSDKPFEERIKTNYDHPFAFDNDLLISQLKDLIDGKTIENDVLLQELRCRVAQVGGALPCLWRVEHLYRRTCCTQGFSLDIAIGACRRRTQGDSSH